MAGPTLPQGEGLAALAQAVRASVGDDASDVFIGSVTGRKPLPLANWNPSHCGDINMEIRRDGTWYHEGTPIKRKELTRLFAGILRREANGEYYLVTPAEKCRVHVELHPLLVIDVEPLLGVSPLTLAMHLNSGGTVPLDADHPIGLEPLADGAAYVHLAHGLTALLTRAAWVRLVEMADETAHIESGGERFSLLENPVA